MNAPDALRFGSGHTVRRIEDPTLVRGRGQFADDVTPAGSAYAVFVRSPHAHARIVSIDADGARAMPGVLAVHTGAELVAAGVKPIPLAPAFKRPDGQPMAAAPRRACSTTRAAPAPPARRRPAAPARRSASSRAPPAPAHAASAMPTASCMSTATMRDTPCSGIVTPTSCCAISIAILLWLMNRNCVPSLISVTSLQ